MCVREGEVVLAALVTLEPVLVTTLQQTHKTHTKTKTLLGLKLGEPEGKYAAEKVTKQQQQQPARW